MENLDNRESDLRKCRLLNCGNPELEICDTGESNCVDNAYKQCMTQPKIDKDIRRLLSEGSKETIKLKQCQSLQYSTSKK